MVRGGLIFMCEWFLSFMIITIIHLRNCILIITMPNAEMIKSGYKTIGAYRIGRHLGQGKLIITRVMAIIIVIILLMGGGI